MTVQNLVELIKDLFPKMGEPRILKEIDIAQKEFCNETKILESRAELSDLVNNTAWVLPTDFLKLKEVQAYDADGYPMEIFNEGLTYEVDLNAIYFISNTSTALVSIPTTIDSMYIVYWSKPAQITAVTDTFSLPDEYYLAMEAFTLSRMYARYPVSMVIKGEKFEQIDRQMVMMHKNTYKEYVREAKKNRYKDDTIDEAVYYPGAGKYSLPKRNKFATLTTTTSLSGLPLLYTKYISFTATSPSTIAVLATYGFIDVTITVDAGVIVITSTAEFSAGIDYDDNQSNNWNKISTSRIEVYPESNWGTLQGRLFITI